MRHFKIRKITRFDEHRTRELFPLLEEGHSSIYISGASRVDGRALCDALLRYAQRNGAEPLLEPLGIDFKVSYQKAQIMHLQVPDANQNTGNWPVVSRLPINICWHLNSRKSW